MKKTLLLLTLTMSLATLGFSPNEIDSKTSQTEDVYQCNYSIITFHSDGSATQNNYSTTSWDSDHCDYIAANHAALVSMSAN